MECLGTMLVPKVPLCFMGCRLLSVSYPFAPQDCPASQGIKRK